MFTFIPANTSASGKMPSGTKVANVSAEKKTETEIQTMLEDAVVIWQAQDDLELEGEFETITVSRDAFLFNIDLTLSDLRDQTDRKISTFFKRPKNVYIPLVVDIDEDHRDIVKLKEKSYIDYNRVVNNLENTAKDLAEKTITLTYIEGEEIPLEKVAEVELDKPKLSAATIDYIVDELDGTLIVPDELFSFLEAIDTPEKLLKSKDETSFIGSGLYALFLQADFEIVARHPQLTLPSYGDKGLNAEVNQRDNKDLIAINKSESSYRLKIKQSKKAMTFILEGNEPTYTYEVNIENEEEVAPRTIYRYSKKLNPGEEQVVQAGENGLTIDVVRSQFDKGTYVSDSIVSRDLYLPTPRILLVSPDEIDEGIEEDVEVALDEDGNPLDEDGAPIYPDGLTDASIADLLPGDLEGNSIYEEIIEVDQEQQRYEEFLDKLLDIYANSVDEVDKEGLEHIELLKERIERLEKTIVKLVLELIETEQIDKSFKEVIKELEGGEEK